MMCAGRTGWTSRRRRRRRRRDSQEEERSFDFYGQLAIAARLRADNAGVHVRPLVFSSAVEADQRTTTTGRVRRQVEERDTR